MQVSYQRHRQSTHFHLSICFIWFDRNVWHWWPILELRPLLAIADFVFSHFSCYSFSGFFTAYLTPFMHYFKLFLAISCLLWFHLKRIHSLMHKIPASYAMAACPRITLCLCLAQGHWLSWGQVLRCCPFLQEHEKLLLWSLIRLDPQDSGSRMGCLGRLRDIIP